MRISIEEHTPNHVQSSVSPNITSDLVQTGSTIVDQILWRAKSENPDVCPSVLRFTAMFREYTRCSLLYKQQGD